MNSSNIYADLTDVSIGEKLIKAYEENKKLLQHIENLKGDITKLCNELTQMKSRESNLKRNISELFNTAMMETNRKQRMITDLQNKLDSFRFRPKGNSYKRSRDNDVDLNEPKKAKIDLTINDKHDKKNSDSSRDSSKVNSSSKSTNRQDSSDKHHSDSSRREKYKDSKEISKTKHSSKSTHRPSTKSKTVIRDHPVKDIHKVKFNSNYFDTNIKIEVTNNERVVNKSDNTSKKELNTINKNSKTEPLKLLSSVRTKRKTKDVEEVKSSKSTSIIEEKTKSEAPSNMKHEKTKCNDLDIQKLQTQNATSTKNTNSEKPSAIEKSDTVSNCIKTNLDSKNPNHKIPEEKAKTNGLTIIQSDSNHKSERETGESTDKLPRTTTTEKEHKNHCQEDTKTIEVNKDQLQIYEHQNILKDTLNYSVTTLAPVDLVKSSVSEPVTKNVPSLELKPSTENRLNASLGRRRRCIIKVVN